MIQPLPKATGPRQALVMALGTVISVASTLGVVTQLPLAPATLVTALGLASLIVACAYISRPLYWWMAVGAIAGMIIGVGGILAGHMAAEKETVSPHLRLTFVAFQATAGFIAGVLVGRKTPQAHLPTLREFLSSLSAITVGLYALVVTGRFL